MSIYKEMRYNTVKVVDGVARQLAVIEQALPGYHFKVITNQGTFIKSAIGEVKDSAVLGIILAVVILFVFLLPFRDDADRQHGDPRSRSWLRST